MYVRTYVYIVGFVHHTTSHWDKNIYVCDRIFENRPFYVYFCLWYYWFMVNIQLELLFKHREEFRKYILVKITNALYMEILFISGMTIWSVFENPATYVVHMHTVLFHPLGIRTYVLNFYKLSHARMFSRSKILFLVSLLFVALLHSILTFLNY